MSPGRSDVWVGAPLTPPSTLPARENVIQWLALKLRQPWKTAGNNISALSRAFPLLFQFPVKAMVPYGGDYQS